MPDEESFNISDLVHALRQQEHYQVRRERRETFLDIYKMAAEQAISKGYAPSAAAEMADALSRKLLDLVDEWLEEEDAKHPP